MRLDLVQSNDTRRRKADEKFCKKFDDGLSRKSFWADANSTLRLTYGKVEGSAPRDGMQYTWFTTMDGIIEKYNTGEADFEVPQRLLDLYEEKNYGQYGTDGKITCLPPWFQSYNRWKFR